jgi:hypothetical protein
MDDAVQENFLHDNDTWHCHRADVTTDFGDARIGNGLGKRSLGAAGRATAQSREQLAHLIKVPTRIHLKLKEAGALCARVLLNGIRNLVFQDPGSGDQEREL